MKNAQVDVHRKSSNAFSFGRKCNPLADSMQLKWLDFEHMSILLQCEQCVCNHKLSIQIYANLFRLFFISKLLY